MKTKTEWKVGLFLAISLALLAALVVNFSKGTNPFTETTLLHLCLLYTSPSPRD